MKLLAVDFDGTVFFPGEGGYRVQDVEAIKRFQQDGNLVGLNTGRALHFTEHFEKVDCPIDFDFYICSSGAQLADANEISWKEARIDFETVRTLSDTFKDVMQVFIAGGMYYTLSDGPNPFFDNPVASLEVLADKSFAGMSFEPDTNEEALEIHKKIQSMNLDVVSQVNHTSVDLSPPGINKGTGLQEMAAYLNVPMKNVFAVGDGDNDAPAIQAAALGFAITAGSSFLKKCADYTVESTAQAIELIEKLGTQDY
ncbi:MAG: HAD family phosphatase [Ileibacterium sp.]|nr:HAD family phosphatase [Ileibacterium sp.]